jgi:hypothetical protein
LISETDAPLSTYFGKPEIDYRTLKLIVGLIAVTMGGVTRFFAACNITSISESYYLGGWAQSFFVGFLFAIASFLLAYNGLSQAELVLSKVAAFAGLAVALFPCSCTPKDEPCVHVISLKTVPGVHYVSAAIMFVILAYFCYVFYRRARGKGHKEAMRRAGVYVVCGLTIVASILTVLANEISHDALVNAVPRLIFWCELAGLVAFGISWLTASRVLPVLTSPKERFSPLRSVNPE